jgi:hypothetical protein
MPSRFGWVDFAEEDRQQMLEVVRLFREQETRDELGILTIWDALANHFFPGTSTIQTRARYMLFIPWIYLGLEEKEVSSAEIAGRARNAEIRLLNVLLASEDTEGVIGKEARESLLRLPSSIYWAGLGVWGIRLFPGSQGQYHRHLDAWHRWRSGVMLTDDGEPVACSMRENWDRGLPEPPDNLMEKATVALTREESQYLQDHILEIHPGTFLAELVSASTHYEAEFPWNHPLAAEVPEPLRSEIVHARHFSDTIHGAALLYNLMLAEARHHAEWIEDYRSRLAAWAKELGERWLELSSWHTDISTFWHSRPLDRSRIPAGTKRFVTDWLRLLFEGAGPSGVATDASARRLISLREERLKGARARLKNPRALELWQGAAGTHRLDFRWGKVTVLVADILKGLGRRGAADA